MLQSNAESMVFIASDSLPPEDESRPGESSRLPTSLSAPVRVGATDRSFDLEGEPEQASGQSHTWQRLRSLGIELAETLVLAVIIFFAVRALAQNFRVEGSSMEPGLHDGEYLLVNKAVYLKINLNTLSKFLPFIDGGDEPE